MQISPAKALQMYQVSKPTLYADMKSGKLSFTKDDRGKRKLDVSELARIYDQKAAANKNVRQNVQNSKDETVLNVKEAVQIEFEKKLLEQKISFLEEQLKTKDESVERWQGAFEKAQKTADKIMLLIEDQSKKPENTEEKHKIDALEKTIKKLMEQEEGRQKRMEQRKQKIIEMRLAKEKEKDELELQENQKRSRGLWSKLFAG